MLLAGQAQAVPTASIPPDKTTLASVELSKPELGGRSSELSMARGKPQSSVQFQSNTATSTGSVRSRAKAKYLMSGLVLAALATPVLLHRSSDQPKAMTVQTQAPLDDERGTSASWSFTGGSLTGKGGSKGNGNGNGNGDVNGGDGEDCEDGDSDGDDEEVCDNEGGDHGDGDVDEGDGDDGGHETPGEGTSGLPEPGTVPLVGAGLLAILAFRRRSR